MFSFQQLASAQFKVLAEGPAFNEPEDHGMPQNLFLNADGGFSIVYENLFAEHYIAPKVGTANQMGDLNEVMLRDVAVSTFDRDGVIKTLN